MFCSIERHIGLGVEHAGIFVGTHIAFFILSKPLVYLAEALLRLHTYMEE
jgi:hypothetical protein